jgi:hypothetical protein
LNERIHFTAKAASEEVLTDLATPQHRGSENDVDDDEL